MAASTMRHLLVGALEVLVVAMPAGHSYGHPGGLDKYGCHHDRKAGTYHCHHGSNAGQSFSSSGQMLSSPRPAPQLRDTPVRQSPATAPSGHAADPRACAFIKDVLKRLACYDEIYPPK